MTAPREVRSITGEIKTKLPGVTFGSTFPRLAAMADKFTVVRSYGSNNNQHTYGSVATAGNPFEASMGAIYSKVAGPLGAGSIPNNTLILPEAVDPSLKLGSNFETKALPTVAAPGKLGSQNGAFNPSGGGTLREDMQLTLEPDRFTDRRALLSKLDSLRRETDGSEILEGADRVQQQAFDVLTAGTERPLTCPGRIPARWPVTTPVPSSTRRSSSAGTTCAGPATSSACRCSWPAVSWNRALDS